MCFNPNLHNWLKNLVNVDSLTLLPIGISRHFIEMDIRLEIIAHWSPKMITFFEFFPGSLSSWTQSGKYRSPGLRIIRSLLFGQSPKWTSSLNLTRYPSSLFRISLLYHFCQCLAIMSCLFIYPTFLTSYTFSIIHRPNSILHCLSFTLQSNLVWPLLNCRRFLFSIPCSGR